MLFCGTGFIAAGETSQVAVAALGTQRIVTALRGGGGKLVVIVWDVAGSGNVERVGTEEDTAQHATLGRVSRVGIVSLGDARVVTAMRDDERNLRLVVWNVAADGGITRVGGPTPGFGTATAGEVSEIAITALSDTRVVTAMRDADGDLRLIAWDVNANGFITRLGFATAGNIGLVSIAPLRDNRVATAIINDEGNLQVIAWSVSDLGDIDRGKSKTIGTAKDVAAVAVAAAPVDVVTAIRNGQDKLQLNGWIIPSDGEIREDRHAVIGQVNKVAVTSLDVRSVVVAMRTDENLLRLHGYVVGEGVSQEAPFATSDLKREVEIAPAFGIVSLGASRVVTAAQRGDILNVRVWDLAPSCP
jgi:hypothetical protein